MSMMHEFANMLIRLEGALLENRHSARNVRLIDALGRNVEDLA